MGLLDHHEGLTSRRIVVGTERDIRIIVGIFCQRVTATRNSITKTRKEENTKEKLTLLGGDDRDAENATTDFLAWPSRNQTKTTTDFTDSTDNTDKTKQSAFGSRHKCLPIRGLKICAACEDSKTK